MEKRSKMSNILLLLGYISLTVLGMLLIKTGGQQQLAISEQVLSIKVSIQTLAGLLCYVLSFLLYMVVLPRFNLSYIAPITTGAVFALVILVSVVVLKESIGLYQWIGIGAIFIGITFMNLKK